MFRYLILALLLIASAALAFFPEPVQHSEAELQIVAELSRAQTDTERVQVAKKYLRNYPDDIPAGETAQEAIGDLLEDKVGFFRARHEELKSLASFYLYAQAADFTLPDSVVQVVVDANRDNFWAWLMFMATEWHKVEPNMDTVIERAETALTLDGSRPEGYFFIALAYLETDQLNNARDALEAGLVCDPLDSRFREMLLDIYLKLRDADAYFKLMSGILPGKPLEVSLATIDEEDTIHADDLRGKVSLLVYWKKGSDICIDRTLQEMNKAHIENQLTLPIYAMHVGDENTDPRPYITDKDNAGNEWHMEFVKSTDDISEQLNIPQRPCVYVIGADGYVHAIVNGKGHTKDLIETVIWLAEEVAKRN
jgi:hypothetical protein